MHKYSKKLSNYFINEKSKDKFLLKKLFIKERKTNDIGTETSWANKAKSKKTRIDSVFFNSEKKYVLVLPHVMIDGIFLAKWKNCVLGYPSARC